MAKTGKKTVDQADEYLTAGMELRNWAAWMFNLRSAVPSAQPGSYAKIVRIEHDYPDFERKTNINADVDRAEICEYLITQNCSRRDIWVFLCSFYFEWPNSRSVEFMKSKGYDCNRNTYPAMLDAAQARLEGVYQRALQGC